MTSTPSYYQISIAGGGSAAPGDGFVDNMTVEQYLANTVGADGSNEASLDNLPPGFSFANSMAKKRGNIRYNAIVGQLGLICNVYVQQIVAAGASAVAPASGFTFNALVEHGDSALRTWDETTPGVALTDPATVLVRAVARALIQTIVVTAEVLDPTPMDGVGVLAASKAVPRYGVRSAALTVGPAYASLAAATAAITVTPLF